ncbi:hypothetical protein ACAG26_24255 [Mycobacterium sp. pUA109]|uniref:hypothetical protein n=1 Tax=Mycobacterium sp. pUA109 TaxID=3238982 RepID=UPI00351ABBB7
MTCTVCTAKTDLFLCGRCKGELRSTLSGLVRGPAYTNGHYGAGGLAFLLQAAHGQTRLGESARRSTDKGSPMLCNLRASELLANVSNFLSTWIRDICETRGVEIPEFRPTPGEPDEPTPTKPAPWLDAAAVYVAAGSPGEYCGECWSYHRGECL